MSKPRFLLDEHVWGGLVDLGQELEVDVLLVQRQPSNYPVQPYANQLVFWQDGAYLLGTVWNDDQDYICDPIPVDFTATGISRER